MGGSVDLVLLFFGIASMVSIWIVGAHIDRRLRTLTIASTILVALAATFLALLAENPTPGLRRGDAVGPGLGRRPDPAPNGGGKRGRGSGGHGPSDAGDLLERGQGSRRRDRRPHPGRAGPGPTAFPLALLLLLLPVLATTIAARTNAFPAKSR